MNSFAKIMLPLIRKIVPATVAQEIVGVQPMSSPFEFTIGEGYYEDGKYFYWAKPPMMVGQVFAYGSPLENDCYAWCQETFGECGNPSTDDYLWFYYASKYYFSREEERTMFILRWSKS